MKNQLNSSATDLKRRNYALTMPMSSSKSKIGRVFNKIIINVAKEAIEKEGTKVSGAII